MNDTAKNNKSNITADELQDLVNIYIHLTPERKNIWLGNGTFLLASQQSEEKKQKEGETIEY